MKTAVRKRLTATTMMLMNCRVERLWALVRTDGDGSDRDGRGIPLEVNVVVACPEKVAVWGMVDEGGIKEEDIIEVRVTGLESFGV